jgi:hypothetical protein
VFILEKDFTKENPRAFPQVDFRYQEYRAYLDSIANNLPVAAREFALADWRLNPNDHKCPHDSWVEYLKLFESASGERRENRLLQIEVRLLGAYHDGYLDLSYKNVRNYSFVTLNPQQNHGDWLWDEIRLSENSFVLHEIEFRNGAEWLIECEDVGFEWNPIK